MKLFSLFFLTFFLAKSCNSEQKQDIETAVIEYTANTRGFFQKIVVQNQKFGISKDRSNENPTVDQKISTADWKKIIEAFQEVDLEGLPTYKGPTEKRFYDGAAIANVKITYQGKTYNSQAFDHNNPPVEIEKLINRITLLALPQ
ncbi:hypothetical protein G4D82_02560 [Flavobacterium sp. CYK-4]|uniref:hypothetical protein n=1 Tax=Flavobacterium lotistagni TaxID=2709660 RepID=UPI001409E978|nr:hypothetical protein [Flavobacterium lotistagni]NHM06091.1 hypothetical protein [Flavobacterium lotistagni]